jgi:branched-chain amino acid transport system substrate-binding protein
MSKPAFLVAAALMLTAPLHARAQEGTSAVVVNAVELSGDGAIAGNNFNNGALLAFGQINAAGGILGREVEVVPLDIQTKAEVAKAALQKAAELQAYAMMGPVFSDMVLATMDEIKAAGRPTFVGAEAASITEQGNPYLFRTSFSQAASMPRLARYLKDGLRVESAAIVWVDNAFGRGGHEAMTKALAAEGIAVVAEVMTAPEQRDFAEVAAKVRQSGASAAFVYLNEREAADCLRALFDDAYGGWIVGETTIAGQSVIDLAGSAANSVRAHVGLTPDALVPGMREFENAFLAAYRYEPDHNALKGYIGAYVLKAATEKAGSFDPKAVAQAVKGISLTAAEHPGVLLDVRYDDKGDLDRVSFIVRVNGRHQEMIAILPAAGGGF